MWNHSIECYADLRNNVREQELFKSVEIGNTMKVGYEGPEYESEFLAQRGDIELSAQDIRDAANKVDEEKATGMDRGTTNASMNAVQQVNIGNTTMSVKDPAPHNPEPTGSRLSVVPA